MRNKSLSIFIAVFLPIFGAAGLSLAGTDEDRNISWTGAEIRILKSLSIESLPPLPNDPSNAYSDNAGAALLGEEIFYDSRFSANGKIACSNCHLPTYSFTDDLPLARGMATTGR
ncbi:MAG: cytochrome c peroxidase, partial [Desulfurivibrionaceae bacterium]|nr:cytochrome c peroxidase [Desulfurivibrionaceae bacterium]